jgi:hypothetical protein
MDRDIQPGDNRNVFFIEELTLLAGDVGLQEELVLDRSG